MITIGKIETKINGEKCSLISKLDIDGKTFDLIVDILGKLQSI